MVCHASGASHQRFGDLRSWVMSDTSSKNDERIDLDEIEAQLAEVELMLERLDQRDT